MEQFTDVIELAIVFFTIGFVVKIILDYSMRKRLIEKGIVDENVKYLFSQGGPAASSLKWGMIMVGVGVAIIIGKLVPYRWSDEITVSGMFILAGLALIVYYFVAPMLDKSKRKSLPEPEESIHG